MILISGAKVTIKLLKEWPLTIKNWKLTNAFQTKFLYICSEFPEVAAFG